MSQEKKLVRVFIKPKEGFFLSLSRDCVTFSFLLLCIYVSQFSAFWTFITGCLFLIYIAAKLTKNSSENSMLFESYHDAIRFLHKKIEDSNHE